MKNDFYVYFHKHLDSAEVFYVGKGRGNRAKTRTNRGKSWTEAAKHGFNIEYYATGLSETDALEIERSLINTLPNLVNCTPASKVEFTPEDYFKHFEVDEDSPSGLKRTKGVWTGTYFKGNTGNCGYVSKRYSSKYWRIKFNNKSVMVHRIIWQLVNGPIDDNMVVDHIDGNGLNNRLSNLRVVCKATNARNRSSNSNNTSGFHNCYVEKDSVRAVFRIDGVLHSRRFSIKKYGQEQAFALACQWREQKIKELNEQGAGYTERHGK